jgi:hypothetical protein
MKKLCIILAALAALCSGVRADVDTSYLLLQGPFGSGDSVENFMWKVIYQPGSLSTGQDLLNAVFGTPVDTNTTYTDGFGSQFEVYKSSSTQGAATYINFGTSSAQVLFTIQFTLDGTPVLQDSSYSPGWNYYVAGGGGSQIYADGVWTYSNDGLGTRLLANDSFDAWAYGATFPPDPIAGAANSPVDQDFASATVLNLVPEPASASFLLVGALVLGMRRRR